MPGALSASDLIAAYTPSDWYWRKDDGTIYGSAVQAFVAAADARLAAWAQGGARQPTRWPVDEAGAQTAAALQAVLTPFGLFVDLSAYAKAKRHAVETGGIAVNGAPFATDRDSQAMIGNAYTYVQASGAASVSFKTAAGFMTLTAEQIKAVALAVGGHVQACFKAEDDVDAGINASPPTIVTFAQVDAAFAGLTASA